MIVFRYLKRDLHLGLFSRIYMMLLPILFAVLQSRECSHAIAYFQQEGIMSAKGSCVDYIMYVFQGMHIFYFSPTEYFTIPIYWFFFQMGIAYFVAYYSRDDFEAYGKSLLLAGKDRNAYWNAKCMWCLCTVVLHYLVAIFVTIICAVWQGASLTFSSSANFLGCIFGEYASYLSIQEIVLLVTVLPLCVTLGISFFQLYFSFRLSSVTAFVAVCSVYVLSAYATAWFLPGSYTMWQRSSYVAEDGLNPMGGLFLATFMIVIFYLAGRKYFKESDVL